MAQHPTSSRLQRYTRGWRLAAAVIVLGAAIAALAWFDYAASRNAFVALARGQAASLRDTIATAAAVTHVAAHDAERQTLQHLLGTARLVADLDRRGLLAPGLLDDVAARHGFFRITVLDRHGTRVHQTHLQPANAPLVDHPDPDAGSAGQGRGSGDRPGGELGEGRAGSPVGLGPVGTALARRLLEDNEREVVSALRVPASARGARLAAGVRREAGGAILVSIEASDVASLHRQSSLDVLLDEIVRTSGDVAYVVLDQSAHRHVVGTAPDDLPPPGAPGAVPGASERQLRLPTGRVLEIAGPVVLEGVEAAQLRIGMRLDALQRAERRTVLRLAVSLMSAIALGALALGLVWLRREYGVLSEQHARAREALQRRDRLAAMGELASTVAHEIRNPLNAIAMGIHRLAQELPDDALRDPETRGLLDIVQQEARRIDATVQQFLEFARPPRIAPRDIQVAPWLVGVLEPLRSMAAATDVQLDVHPAEVTAQVDPDLLRQALENIVRNAIEATPPGGRVGVAAQVAGDALEIAVHDTGPGVPEDVLPRIFSLYFTTKPGGTGVGLAVAQQAVTAHGGTIEVDTVAGRGTTMRIRVPLRGIDHA